MTQRRFWSVCLLFVLALTALGAPSLLAQTAGRQENVSNSEAQSDGVAVAVDGNSLKVAWGERQNNAIAVSEKNVGAGWPGPTLFGEGSTTQYQWPDIAVAPNGATHIAYAAGDTIYHRSKPANGGWSGPRAVATDTFPNPVRIAVAPDGTIWIVWRDTDGNAISYARSTDNGNSWSSGEVARESGNMSMPDVAVGSDNVPHVVWYLRQGSANGGTARYADWNGSGWNTGNVGGSGDYVADPVIVTEPGRSVQHIAFRRQSGDNWIIQHAVRGPGQNWGGYESIRTTPGNAGYAPAIAVDGVGSVHVTWSELTGAGGRDVFYSYKLPGRGYNVPINVSERGGGWNSRSAIVLTGQGGGVIAHIFYQRGERGQDVDEIFYRSYGGLDATAPTPTTAPAPTATPLPAPATGTFDFADPAFRDLWTRTDALVQQGAVSYSWIWGPAAFTAGVREYYVQSPGQARLVQYFDKSRMEINQPSAPRGPFYVTNGRLADELITGLLQTGDAQYEQRNAARIAVAGDPQNEFPQYRDLQAVYRKQLNADRANQILYRAADGSIKNDLLPSANTDPSTVITQRVGGLGIPRIFWDFMNRPGRVVQNGVAVNANPLFDWRYVVGEPLTEAYWTVVKVGGVDRGVLVQAFERRVLTYTPTNSPAFQVEMGNIGRHYFEWRYGVRPR